jgi:hypothetical protein
MPPGKRKTTKEERRAVKAYKRNLCKHKGCQIKARDETAFAGFCKNHHKAFKAAGGLLALTRVR